MLDLDRELFQSATSHPYHVRLHVLGPNGVVVTTLDLPVKVMVPPHCLCGQFKGWSNLTIVQHVSCYPV